MHTRKYMKTKKFQRKRGGTRALNSPRESYDEFAVPPAGEHSDMDDWLCVCGEEAVTSSA